VQKDQECRGENPEINTFRASGAAWKKRLQTLWKRIWRKVSEKRNTGRGSKFRKERESRGKAVYKGKRGKKLQPLDQKTNTKECRKKMGGGLAEGKGGKKLKKERGPLVLDHQAENWTKRK